MTAMQFDRVHDRVFRLPTPFEGGGLVNLYIIRGDKTAVVDSGVLGTPTNYLAPSLEAIGLKLGDVDFVLNTHGHMDHLGGNSELKDAGAEIALHRNDLALAESNRRHIETAAAAHKVLGLERVMPDREAFLLRMLGREVGVDRVLEDGDTVDLGADVRLQVVHTPGHTAGAVCYWWEAAGLLITGDSIQARGSRAGGMTVIEQPSSYPDGLDKAEAVQAQTLLMGHAFKSVDGSDLGPVASGARVADVFRVSRDFHTALTEAFGRALADAPDASGAEIARRAIDLVRDAFTLEDESSTGFPPSGAMTLPNYLKAARA